MKPERADEGDEPIQRLAPPPSAAAGVLFGDRLPLAQAYAERLAGAGVERGLLGPREAARLWERHLDNCAVVGALLPAGSRVVDLGSGAGLPGVVLAIVRPDVHFVLVEPLARRAAFLTETVAELGLPNAEVRRARAEELHGQVRCDVVTARAVAPLDRLASWSLPLLVPGGTLLALKGITAADEIPGAATTLRRLGAVNWGVEVVGVQVVEVPTTVVRVQLGTARRAPGRAGRSRRRSSR